MSNKIGLYFKNALPSTIPNDEDFSFYFIKYSIPETVYLPEGVTATETYNYNNIFLGKKNPNNTSTFFQINKEDKYFFKVINGVIAQKNNGFVNLTLNDVVKYGGTTLPIKINNNYFFSDTTDNSVVFLGSYTAAINSLSNNEKRNFIKNKFEKTIFTGHFGYDVLNPNQKFISNILNINNLFIKYQTVSNSIILGTDIIVEDIQTVNVFDNNLFLGGSFIDKEALTENISNKIEGNVFVKNLGYGNISKSFIFLPKLNLNNITTYVNNYTSLDLLFRTASGEIQKITSVNFLKPVYDRITTNSQDITNNTAALNNIAGNISNLDTKINTSKYVYNFDGINYNLIVGWGNQTPTTGTKNTFTINLDQNNTDYNNNILQLKYISGNQSELNLKAKLKIPRDYMSDSTHDPLATDIVTYSPTTGEFGIRPEVNQFRKEKFDLVSATGKKVILTITYNSYFVFFNIETNGTFTMDLNQEEEFVFVPSNLQYWVENNLTLIPVDLNDGSGFIGLGHLSFITRKNAPNKFYIKTNSTTSVTDVKFSYGIQVITTII